MSMDKSEAVYLVDDASYLHLKETESGFHYAVFDIASKALAYTGDISWPDLAECPIRSPLAAARFLAIQDVRSEGCTVAGVALRTLEAFKESEVHRRQIWEPETLPQKDIRFINSDYQTLFYLPNGGSIEVELPNRKFTARCEYLDNYHTRIGDEVYHICQYAEILERKGGSCRPEPENFKEDAAWILGRYSYLVVETFEDSFHYSLYDRDLDLTDAGRLEDPALSMNEARDQILAAHRLGGKSRVECDYATVLEMAARAEQKQLEESRPSALKQLSAQKSVHPDHPKIARTKEAER